MSVGVLNPPDASVTRDRSQLILAQLDRLPTLSTSITRLLAVTCDHDSSTRDLIAVIEPDPSLTTSVLRMVRRSDLGARQDDMTVAKAVRLLGFDAVRNAALSHQFFQSLSGADADEEATTRRNGLWRHCIATACVAQQLADALERGPSPGEAFVAGLLHDVGKVGLDACFPKSYARVVDRCEHEPTSVCDIESDVFGLDHTVAGRRLAARWRLPAAIVEAIWLHHQQPDQLPSTTKNPDLVRLIHLADGVVRSTLNIAGPRRPFDVESACGSLGLATEVAVKVLAGLSQQTAPLFEAVGLDVHETPESRIETLTRANLELSQTNARLMTSNERLVRRDECLAALSEFLRRESGQSLAETCAAAADAMRSAFRTDQAVVVTADDGEARLHVGVSGVEAPATRATVLVNADHIRLAPGEEPGTVQDTDPSLRDLCERFLDECGGERISTVVLGVNCVAILPLTGLTIGGSDEQLVAGALGSAIESRRARDAADRMTEELLTLNRRLAAAQQEAARRRSLSMIAAMAGGAAHEINNPLAVISGRAQLEQSRTQEPELRKVWETIVEQAHRASGIVSELMDFAKPRTPSPLTVPLVDLVQTACQRCSELRGLNPAQIRQEFADPGLTVYGDPRQLSQVLEALLDNALDATDVGTKAIEVNSRSTASDETVRVRVRDEGAGMVPEVLEHALDPFYSSRPAGRGRGLGLSRAYRLVEINGGRLWIESSPQLGTTVTVELPARSPQASFS